ncbi:MAG: alpha/beta hydrolase [Gammaproteobacteria bacterium]|nr:alpha/beta hydrolase [Gammaproteobacteria bacterium]
MILFFNYLDVVIFDPRGCRKSSIENSLCYSMDVYIDDIEDIRQQLEIDKVVILGTSYGSMVAQGYAIKYGKEKCKIQCPSCISWLWARRFLARI